MKKCVFFDLDGTLLDTLADLAQAGNHALKNAGRPTYPLDAYRQLAGSGMANLLRRAAPKANEEQVEAMRRELVTYYQQHLTVHTLPYPGMAALVQDLHKAGNALYICTNKPQKQAEILTEHFFLGCFDGVYAQQDGRPIKPDPWSIHQVCRERGFALKNCILAGDSNVDVQTARNAGIAFVGASWGFRGREELIQAGAACVADTADDMKTAFEQGGFL